MEYYQKNSTTDYASLVNALTCQITPEYRAVILDKLVEINNQLLAKTQSSSRGNQFVNQSDPARSCILNPRKKDVSELQHPSTLANSYTPSIVPITRPSHSHALSQTPSQYTPSIKKTIEPEFNIDDIIDDFELSEETTSLDDKLNKLSSLHKKILSEKKMRRKIK